MTRIKVCCIASREEAQAATRAGASALGLVSAMPSGPGVIDDAAIAAIAPDVPPGIATFLLTARQDAEAIIDQQRAARATVLQLVDHVAVGEIARLRAALSGIGLVQVIHVMDGSALDEALAVAPHVDALLLDSGNTRLPVKQLGGTGRTHDWSISATIRERCGKPLYLAGGLNAGNVAEAIRAVRPFGVDVCSGVRSEGRLDAAKLSAFVAAVRGCV